MMKKRILFLGIALCAMLNFSSCEKENQGIGVEDAAQMTLTASMEQPEQVGTKTSLGETAGGITPVLWTFDAKDASKCDKIRVYASGEFGVVSVGFRVSSINSENQQAVFTGTTPTGTLLSAIYPWKYASVIFHKTVRIDEVQKYKANGVEDNTLPMYAEFSSLSEPIEFKQLCGILKLELKAAATTSAMQKVSKIEFISKDNIAGTATITYNDGQPTLAFTENQSTTITLDCGDGVVLSETATAFHIVVPPTTANTFTVKIILTNGDVMTKTAPVNDANKINRAKIKTMPAIDFVKTYSIYDYIDEYGVNHGKGVTIPLTIDGETKNITWAPVNCGYEAPKGEYKGYPFGKLYQWGRKDGQGYDSDDASVPNIVDGKPRALAEAEANTFYKGWDNIIAPDGTWGGTDGKTRTDNDPCPDGWRVPTKVEFEALIANKSSWTTEASQWGYWFSGSIVYSPDAAKVFFPAAGFRDYNGNVYYRGSDGCYWSSSVSTNAYCFHFDREHRQMESNQCAYGYSVRCIEE